MLNTELDLTGIAFEAVSEERSEVLLRQILLEMPQGHILYPCRKQLGILAETARSDDIIVSTGSVTTPLALFHLTWRQAPEPVPAFPTVTLFADAYELRGYLLAWFAEDPE